MSTTYHELHPPITSVRCLPGVFHTHVTLWINGANAGKLTLRNEEVSEFLLSISEQDQDDFRCAARTSGGMIRVNGDIPEDRALVSENGELTDLRTLLVTYKQEPSPCT